MELPPPQPALIRPVDTAPEYLNQIGWTPATTRRRPVVAVLDTGVDPTAPGLSGAIDTENARSFVASSPNPLRDREGHGTHVATIVARVAGGGAAPGVNIVPITIAAADGTTGTRAMVNGINYAVARRAQVINISFGGTGFSGAEQRAIHRAVRSGALVVVAAGNSGQRGGPAEYPGAYRHVMAVAALGTNGRAIASSGRGDQVAIAAPGENIPAGRPILTSEGQTTPTRTGTSMAAAVVSGAAVRVWARSPGLSAQQVRTVLEASAHDVPPAGPDTSTGVGAVNLRAALRTPRPPAEDAEPNEEPPLAADHPPLIDRRGARTRVQQGRTGSWADPRDGFSVYLAAGDTLRARLRGPAESDFDLVLLRPGAPGGTRTASYARRWVVHASLGPTSDEQLIYRANVDGFHTLEVQGGRRAGAYTLRATRTTSTGRVTRT